MPRFTDQLLDAPCVDCDTYAVECDGTNRCDGCRADELFAEILAAHYAELSQLTEVGGGR